MSLVERLLGRSRRRGVDPHLRGPGRWLRPPAGEAFGVRGVGRGEHGRARRDALVGVAMVHVVGRQQAEAAVPVLGVVPGEERVAVGAGIVDRAEALREVRPVLQGLELRLREGVVVGDVGRRSAEVGRFTSAILIPATP